MEAWPASRLPRLQDRPPGRKLVGMRRWILLVAVLAAPACWWRHTPLIARDDLEDLESAAADELRCEDLEVHRLTLLTRLVEGCGHQRVYAWDPLREQWVVASVERR